MDLQQIKSDMDNGVLLGRETLRALIDAALADAQRLDWLEAANTLHNQVEFLYVVEGYEALITRDGTVSIANCAKGETIREAIDNLREKTK